MIVTRHRKPKEKKNPKKKQETETKTTGETVDVISLRHRGVRATITKSTVSDETPSSDSNLHPSCPSNPHQIHIKNLHKSETTIKGSRITSNKQSKKKCVVQKHECMPGVDVRSQPIQVLQIIPEESYREVSVANKHASQKPSFRISQPLHVPTSQQRGVADALSTPQSPHLHHHQSAALKPNPHD